ncbi:2-isopropylmalate synthase [Marinihelvus fidelis]|uniref:2-isopropylmalate synthase n=1 Tax=Marinihelvus fidelis TaxID=2613842 RepID=A0A5N0TIS1_9GAMM|nr:2-isopropylmalate synthase [Marinihelvus fidelis]KAA9133997.1 2-isopropylmalate synthase [Marinihelvus fidelis]
MPDIKIFDTSLRDGEQSPGFSMTHNQKLRVARALADLKVDIIEAGFPAASPGDFAAVQAVAREIEGPTIAALCRTVPRDIEKAGEALLPAKNRRIHTFIATSPIHRRDKLGMDKAEVLKNAVAGVELARSFCDDVEFSAEDGIRTERDYLAEVLAAVIEAGATTVNIPDTVGYSTPQEMTELFRWLSETVPGIGGVTISTHCHNDLGLAVANSLAAVEGGARQIECTLNGVGERAGNCALEEVVMALRTRSDRYACRTNIDTRKLHMASHLLAAVTGNFVPRNKAIVGENAFAHESGIHQHGMLASRETYEIMKPEDVGVLSSQLILGKHSGKHAVIDRARAMGYELAAGEIDGIMAQFKELADAKKRVYDADLEAIITGNQAGGELGPWSLQWLSVVSRVSGEEEPTASLTLAHEDGTTATQTGEGDGPVDAIVKALEAITGMDIEVTNLAMRSISLGEDAQGESTMRARVDGTEYSGHGLSTDIVAACAEALLEIINRASRNNARIEESEPRSHVA